MDAPPRLGTIEEVAALRKWLELLERVRSAAQAFVDAPRKFGIRHSAYRSLVKALENEWSWTDLHGRQEP